MDLSSDSEEEEEAVTGPFKDAYDCLWLKKFAENLEPQNLDEKASE